jgi:hypothetical protein
VRNHYPISITCADQVFAVYKKPTSHFYQEKRLKTTDIPKVYVYHHVKNIISGGKLDLRANRIFNEFIMPCTKMTPNQKMVMYIVMLACEKNTASWRAFDIEQGAHLETIMYHTGLSQVETREALAGLVGKCLTKDSSGKYFFRKTIYKKIIMREEGEAHANEKQKIRGL